MVRQGDCREILFQMLMDGERFEAVVTDPPYDLTSTVERFGKPDSAPIKDPTFARMSKGFMGKTWDGSGVAFDPATWEAVYSVMKPGAHLLAFGGSRTYHRMACAIEDAGFELRDCIMYLYGTGFPKSHDVSKAIDKAAGAEREVVGMRQYGDGGQTYNGGTAAGRSAGIAGDKVARAPSLETAPATAEAAQWQGWGTALKPAFEPIIVARKPIDQPTVAANVLTHGTGAINIDACRVPATGRPLIESKSENSVGVFGDGLNGSRAVGTTDAGRHPANVIHDGSEEVEAAFARFDERGAAAPVRGDEPSDASRGRVTGRRARAPGAFHADSGTASRFYYSAKAGKADRAGSSHPTVKPLALMRYLCKLVTPPGGTILDPFAGSGTTLQAALECGFKVVGIEREAEYIADIEQRLFNYFVA